MDRLEILVRDTLAEHAGAAPQTLPTRAVRRPGRTWWAAVAAATAVAGVAALASGWDTAPTRQTQPSPAGGTTSNPSGVPVGFKLVSYHGIELAVPRTIAVTHSPCLPPVNAVFVPTGAAYSCPAQSPNGGNRLPATSTGVWLDTPDARVATTKEPTGRRTVDDVTVRVTAPTSARVHAILDTVHAVTVDHLGCPAHPPSITPTGQPASSELVPGKPTSAVVCELAPIGAAHDYWLVGSYRLPPDHVTPLAAAINALPSATATSDNNGYQYDWIQFRYPTGTTRTIAAPTDIEPAYVSDGRHTVVDTHTGIDLFPLLQRRD